MSGFRTRRPRSSATVKQRPRRVGPSGITASGAAAGDTLDERGIADFAAATVAASKAGFDGVEIHGAHGYLPDQFLWARTNCRRDGYGAGERTRFVAELVRACKAAAGSDFPIILRLSRWKSFDYAARLADTSTELEQLLQLIVAAGVDAIHCSTRRFWEPGFAGDPLTLAGWMRRIGGVPVIAVGSVTLEADFKQGKVEATCGIADSAPRGGDVEAVARLIVAGEFDMIAVGPALIANPDSAMLVCENRLDALQPFNRELLATLA